MESKNNDLLRINVEILGKNYPININRSQEEIFRKAATFVNDKIIAYKELYGGNPLEQNFIDDTRILSMVALDLAVENLVAASEKELNTEQNLQDQQNLNNAIDAVLADN